MPFSTSGSGDLPVVKFLYNRPKDESLVSERLNDGDYRLSKSVCAGLVRFHAFALRLSQVGRAP